MGLLHLRLGSRSLERTPIDKFTHRITYDSKKPNGLNTENDSQLGIKMQSITERPSVVEGNTAALSAPTNATSGVFSVAKVCAADANRVRTRAFHTDAASLIERYPTAPIFADDSLVAGLREVVGAYVQSIPGSSFLESHSSGSTSASSPASQGSNPLDEDENLEAFEEDLATDEAVAFVAPFLSRRKNASASSTHPHTPTDNSMTYNNASSVTKHSNPLANLTAAIPCDGFNPLCQGFCVPAVLQFPKVQRVWNSHAQDHHTVHIPVADKPHGHHHHRHHRQQQQPFPPPALKSRSNSKTGFAFPSVNKPRAPKLSQHVGFRPSPVNAIFFYEDADPKMRETFKPQRPATVANPAFSMGMAPMRTRMF